MFEKVIKYYNKKLGPYNLVFKFVKVRWHICSALMYLALILIPAAMYIIFVTNFRIIDLLIFVPLLITFILILNLNTKAKSILKQKYNINSEGGSWRTISFDEYQVDLLIKYLKNNNLYSVDIISKLISLVYKEAEENKYKGFIWPGVLLALFIPIWNQIVINGYKGIEVPSEILETTIIFLVYSLLFVISLSIFKRLIEDLSRELFNGKHIALRKLGRLLENVLLQAIKDEKIKGIVPEYFGG